MAEYFSIDTSSIDRLLDQFKEYEYKVINTASWRAVRAGAKVARDAMRNAAPKRTGALAKSAGISGRKGKKTISRDGKVGLNVRLKYVKVRPPKTGRKRANAKPKGINKYYAGYVTHGTKFMRARPFVDAAFRSSKENIASTVTKTLEAELRKYI